MVEITTPKLVVEVQAAVAEAHEDVASAGELEVGDDAAAEAVAPERDGGVDVARHDVRVVEADHRLGWGSRVRTTLVVLAR
jgi:hypothetical protein